MSNKIEGSRYWDRPWSLVDGCTPCSPGCLHCWSMAMGKRFYRWPDVIVQRFDRLDIPVRVKKPTVWAVWNDLFHEDVSDRFIDDVMARISQCTEHTFLVLTKRPVYMRKIMQQYYQWPNLWLGVTVCNQQEADEKIPLLLQTPAAHKWISIEPMLGPIDKFYGGSWFLNELDAVILGGETGPGARPMHPDWVRSIRDQCHAAGVPFFFKGWGEWVGGDATEILDGRPGWCNYQHGVFSPNRDKEWNSERVSLRVGSKKAGRMLDGKEYNDLPWIVRANNIG